MHYFKLVVPYKNNRLTLGPFTQDSTCRQVKEAVYQVEEERCPGVNQLVLTYQGKLCLCLIVAGQEIFDDETLSSSKIGDIENLKLCDREGSFETNASATESVRSAVELAQITREMTGFEHNAVQPARKTSLYTNSYLRELETPQKYVDLCANQQLNLGAVKFVQKADSQPLPAFTPKTDL